jgi:hypothetical protein
MNLSVEKREAGKVEIPPPAIKGKKGANEVIIVQKLGFFTSFKNNIQSLFNKQQWVKIKKGRQEHFVKVSSMADENLTEKKVRSFLLKNQTLDWRSLQDDIETKKAYKQNKEYYDEKIAELQKIKELNDELSKKEIKKIVVYVNTKAKIQGQDLKKTDHAILVNRKVSRLPGKVEIHPNDEVHVHIKKLGEGTYKAVKRTLIFDFHGSQKVMARAKEKKSPKNQSERNKELLEACRKTEQSIATDKDLEGKGLVTATVHRIKKIDPRTKEVKEEEVLIMKEYNAGTLLDHILDPVGALKLKDMVKISRDAAKGYDELHKRGIVHQDGKLENILLHKKDDGSYEVGIADFGLSWYFRTENVPPGTNTMAPGGTPAYLPPESPFVDPPGESAEGPKGDVWALGCVMFCLALGYDEPPVMEENASGYPVYSLDRALGLRNEVLAKKDKEPPGPKKEYLEIIADTLKPIEERPSMAEVHNRLNDLITNPEYFK